MIITPLDVDYISMVRGPEPDDGLPRSHDHRPHLTDIIRDLAAAIGKSKGNGSISEEDLNAYAAGGWTFEYLWDMAFNKALQDGSIVQPGEYELNGIVGTPDRIRVEDDGELTVIEIKVRWMSAYKFDQLETYFWQETMQVKSYCALVGTTHAELICFFICGNWHPPTPIAKGVKLEFTEREIQENWDCIVNHGKRMGVL
jgi:hypothetical protein